MRSILPAIALLCAGCSASSHALQPKETRAAETQTGIASWYGADLQGRSTANGETFDQNALSAAHRTWPMPSLVEVTNLENNKRMVVRVNDRGPFAEGRLIDLSRAAARALGFESEGQSRVAVRYLGAAPNSGQAQ